MTASHPSRSAVQSQPNVTPMIDVMLVLLIVVMVAAPFLITGIPAVPPTGVNLTAHPVDPSDFTLGLDARGQLYLNKLPIERTALGPRLHALFARTEDRALYLRADRSLDYARVQETMDVAARSGARVVGLITQQAPGRRDAGR